MNPRPSYHSRTRKIPHPDVLREHVAYQGSEQPSDDQLTADYLVTRTVAGAENLNPYPPGKRSDAYLSHLSNQQFMIERDPSYRPAMSAHDMRGLAQAEVDSIHTED
jgi:hypothetical protein